MKKIYIPHLHYTILVKEPKQPPEEAPNAKAWVKSDGKTGCTIFTRKNTNAPDVAHEVVHILQFIALERNIDFTLEQEHFGYLMQYILAELMGYKWK